MAEITIDAKNAIMGRLFTYVAKQALLGNTLHIVNCEHMVISGRAEVIRERYYKRMFDLGMPNKGPHISRLPDKFAKRMIRNMVPYKQQRGKDALARIRFHIGVPAAFKDATFTALPHADATTLPGRSVTVQKLLHSLGGTV